MSDAMMQEILKRIDTLSEKLGAGGAFAWETLMRQALWVDGVMQVVISLVLFGVAYGLIKLTFWFWRPAPEDSRYEYAIEEDFVRFFGSMLTVTGAVITGIMSLVYFFDGLQHVINPQYYALVSLSQMLVGK